ncbi:hypothetical protein IFM89_001419, partial [Coptis chinensis]
SCNMYGGSPLMLRPVPKIGIIAFVTILYVSFSSSCLILCFCRALDPISLPYKASQLVKQHLLNFVRSLSTVLAFAYCLPR